MTNSEEERQVEIKREVNQDYLKDAFFLQAVQA